MKKGKNDVQYSKILSQCMSCRIWGFRGKVTQEKIDKTEEKLKEIKSKDQLAYMLQLIKSSKENCQKSFTGLMALSTLISSCFLAIAANQIFNIEDQMYLILVIVIGISVMALITDYIYDIRNIKLSIIEKRLNIVEKGLNKSKWST